MQNGTNCPPSGAGQWVTVDTDSIYFTRAGTAATTPPGKVGIGKFSAALPVAAELPLQLNISATDYPSYVANGIAGISETFYGTGNTRINMRRANGSATGPTTIVRDDRLSALNTFGFTPKANFQLATQIISEADGAAPLDATLTGGIPVAGTPGRLMFFTSPGGLVDTGKGAVERMRITSAGFVGIGTKEPGVALHVAGNAFVEGDSSFLNKLGVGPIGPNSGVDTDANLVVKGNGSIEIGNVTITGGGSGANSYVVGSNIHTKVVVGDAIMIVHADDARAYGTVAAIVPTVFGIQLVSDIEGTPGIAYRDSRLFEVKNIAGDSKIVINKTGNVGIGTASPGAKLHVKAAGGFGN